VLSMVVFELILNSELRLAYPAQPHKRSAGSWSRAGAVYLVEVSPSIKSGSRLKGIVHDGFGGASSGSSKVG
jgi:hypothetical protein